MKYFLDSYAWIEYLEGSSQGQKIKNILEGNNEVYSLNLCIAEVVSKIQRKELDAEIAYKAIISNSKILQLTPKLSKEAAFLHADTRKKEKNFGLVDAILLTMARSVKSKIITGDNHFKHFKEVIFLGQ